LSLHLLLSRECRLKSIYPVVASEEEMATVAEQEKQESQLVLLVREGGFGLPTACPACLPWFVYLKLSSVSFQTQYSGVEPDSEDLPAVEYGEAVGFASESGGILEFLKREKIADLDAALTEGERAELESCKAMVESWIVDASLYEIWMRDNDKAVRKVYFAALPMGLSYALDWKQRHSVMQRLGVTTENAKSRGDELLRKAGMAYQALSVRLQDQKLFFGDRPTSLDALVLGHLLFHLNVSLEVSNLREEISKYPNLVTYAQSLKSQLLGGDDGVPMGSAFGNPKAPPPPSPPPTSTTHHSSPDTSGKEKPANKSRNDKEKLFKKRAKYFVIAQFVAILMYVVVAGIDFEDDAQDDDGSDDE
jgi:metaxin